MQIDHTFSHSHAINSNTRREIPLVSVVIPTFNRSSALSRAIASVQNQTFRSLEILVIDDGSTDDTESCIQRLKTADSRIRYFRMEKNKGAQAARNMGIKNTRGKWIAFLDSDDAWLPNSLERRLKAAQAQRVDVIHSECYVKREAGELMPFGVPRINGNCYKVLLSGPGPVFPAVLATKESLERIGYLDERIVAYQEWDTSIRLAKHFSYGFIDEPTFIYDCMGKDTISKNLLRGIFGYKQVLHKHLAAILLFTGPWTLARHYRNIASMYREAGRKHAFLRYAALSFALWPFCPRLIKNQIQKFLVPKFFRA